MADKPQNPQQKQQLTLRPGWLISPSLRSTQALGIAWYRAMLLRQSRKPDFEDKVSENGR
jgi:hypothetical protein